MTTVDTPTRSAGRIAANWLRKPVLATGVLLLIMYSVGVVRYKGFDDTQVVLNIFIDNAFLLVVAVGMTFVILTGGIDLSVGAVVALTTMITATLLEKGINPALVVLVALAVGGIIGLGMGAIIHFFDIQPFIATLAGMFLARGTCYVISTDSIPITNETWNTIASDKIRIGGFHIGWSVVISAVVVISAAYVLAYTRLGRNIYALGGNQQSAMLMGLPVGRTKIAVYTISGLCSALGGILLTFYTPSGYGLNALGMELDAIAAVVIGGTVLTGGSGFVLGTVLGVGVLGLIQSLITFQGTLSSWWTKIFIGTLLFVFIVLQRTVTRKKTARRTP
ncbi:galactofuranose ABC transporter, permease protein YjfF [Dactylosporangium matsuzakiense]|uniref:Sugar ABC transporter permease n=1 Tax=Dactylosporangium matsuzakiense TaxID=53360 RepID=A0A9W6KUL7_9ACTN|nr:galactofuranose ABC transporter, permease protein YjfF [Dactylosporangium matsuzakiense]UWZ49072.1 sugar ABC transporter permease YjfF [Dactylosporangium matsuzakiense]GLL07500.1 sugar ABC transporter permease [Dactylosporangium matsuzakiense]